MSFLTYRDLAIVALAAAALVLAALVDHRWMAHERHRRTDPACSRYRQPHTRRAVDRARGRSCPVCIPAQPRARR